jgi:hypothetical protein
MSPSRLVSGERAGPHAIGILVPPGRRTFLIVRPRSLSLDLLVLADAKGDTFREFEREQAGRAAETLFELLTAGSSSPSIEAFPTRISSTLGRPAHVQLRVSVGPFHLLVCERLPGKPYAALAFTDSATAEHVAERIRALLCPAPAREQEFYLNTRHFER